MRKGILITGLFLVLSGCFHNQPSEEDIEEALLLSDKYITEFGGKISVSNVPCKAQDPSSEPDEGIIWRCNYDVWSYGWPKDNRTTMYDNGSYINSAGMIAYIFRRYGPRGPDKRFRRGLERLEENRLVVAHRPIMSAKAWRQAGGENEEMDGLRAHFRTDRG